MISAATARRNVLEPSIEAQAHNDRQALLIHNATADCDSLLERLNLLTHHAPAIVADCLSDVRRIVESNAAERAEEHRIAGFGDQLVTDLRRVELNEPHLKLAMPAKQVAAHAREPLSRIAHNHDLVSAVRAIDTLIRRVPRAQLLSPTVQYELGAQKYALLLWLVEERGEVVA